MSDIFYQAMFLLFDVCDTDLFEFLDIGVFQRLDRLEQISLMKSYLEE